MLAWHPTLVEQAIHLAEVRAVTNRLTHTPRSDAQNNRKHVLTAPGNRHWLAHRTNPPNQSNPRAQDFVMDNLIPTMSPCSCP
ncbi:hypothetical protein Acsp05_58440 [Actinokineospora sp. NBRC 105648]|nr:hypothetical protein Acsp05_58440 [Actinokineospora sp. NBRC 105648]